MHTHVSLTLASKGQRQVGGLWGMSEACWCVCLKCFVVNAQLQFKTPKWGVRMILIDHHIKWCATLCFNSGLLVLENMQPWVWIMHEICILMHCSFITGKEQHIKNVQSVHIQAAKSRAASHVWKIMKNMLQSLFYKIQHEVVYKTAAWRRLLSLVEK